eukprot:gene29405-36457_t
MKTDFDFTLLKKQAICNVYADVMQDGGVFFHVQSVVPGEEQTLGVETLSEHLRMDINGGILLHGERSPAAKIARENATKALIRSKNAPKDIAAKQATYEQLAGRIALNASSCSGGGPSVNSRPEYCASKVLKSHHDTDSETTQHQQQRPSMVGERSRTRSGSEESKVSFQSTSTHQPFGSSATPSIAPVTGPISKPVNNTSGATPVPPRKSVITSLFTSTSKDTSKDSKAPANFTPAVTTPADVKNTNTRNNDVNTPMTNRTSFNAVSPTSKEVVFEEDPDVFATAVFVIDPKLDFVPDWIEEGVHDGVLDDNMHLYSEIESRLNEHRQHQQGGGRSGSVTGSVQGRGSVSGSVAG